MDAGYHGPRVQMGVYIPGTGGCRECLRTTEREQRVVEGRYIPSNEPHIQAVAASSAGISGYLAAHLVIALLTGVPQIKPGAVYGINLVALDTTENLEYPRRPDCPVCSSLT